MQERMKEKTSRLVPSRANAVLSLPEAGTSPRTKTNAPRWLFEVVGKGLRNTHRQRVGEYLVFQREHQRAIPLEQEVMGKHSSESVYKVRLAEKVYRVVGGVLFLRVNADGAATLVPRRICGLTPLQCFLQLSDTFGFSRRPEHQLPDDQKFAANSRRVRVEFRGNFDTGEGLHLNLTLRW